MADETMRERVARAMALRHCELGGHAKSDPAYWFMLAGAALRALREPTEAMVNAAPDRAIKSITITSAPLGSVRVEPIVELSDPRVNWRAMIDFALGDVPPAA